MLDVLLVTVTVVSLVLAGVMAVVSRRVIQLDRRRSDVRVASLRAAARERAMAYGAETGLLEHPTVCGPADSTGAEVSGVSPALFAERGSSHGARVFVAVAIASVIFMAVAVASMVLSTRSARADAGSSLAPAVTPAALPLELLALDHVREGSVLAVRGRVRNPASALAMKDVVAVAYLFDRTGGRLGVSRAPVGETVLEPGAESRFEILVPDAAPVARYRVTFQVNRAAVPHMDHRTAPGTQDSPASRVAVAAQRRGGVTAAPAVR
jgi:hypothetical protein